MDDKMMMENSDSNYSDLFTHLFIKMFQLSQEADILDQISILMIKIEQYQIDFKLVPYARLIEIHQNICKIYENEILRHASKVIQNQVEDGNQKQQKQLKEDQLDQGSNKIQAVNHGFEQQNSLLQQQMIEQNQYSGNLEEAKIKYKHLQKLSAEYELTFNQTKMLNYEYHIVELFKLEQSQLELIQQLRNKILGDYASVFKEQIIWGFPNTNYHDKQILEYIGYLIYTKIQDFKNFFNTSGRNSNIQELYFLVSIFLFNRSHINQIQKKSLFENLIQMYTQQLYTFEEDTIYWCFGGFQDKQNLKYIKVLQFFKKFKENPLYQNTILHQEIVELQISQQQLFLFQLLEIKDQFIENTIILIEKQFLNTFKMNVNQDFIRKLLTDIQNSPVFKQSVDQNDCKPIFNDIPIEYVYCSNGSTSGQTNFDGTIYINIFKVADGFKSLDPEEINNGLVGYIIKIAIHEFFHYLLRYYHGTYNQYTPEIKKIKK